MHIIASNEKGICVSSSDVQQRRLIYFADPMCSWCWGFSPVIERIAKEFGEALPIRLVMGGLRAGNNKAMDQGMKNDIKGHWGHVHERTGQSFDFSFFDRDGFVYDTGPACRAIVAMRRAAPGRELAFLKVLHEAFYAKGVDLTSGPELLRLAMEFGIEEERFAQSFAGEECSQELASDFKLVHDNGIRAFPALLGGSEADRFMAVTHGYRSFEELKQSLERLISADELPNGLMPGVPADACVIGPAR